MMSLESALVFFLLLSCFLFSLIYSLVDNHRKSDTIKDFFANMKIYFIGLVLCGVFVNVMQEIFGQ